MMMIMMIVMVTLMMNNDDNQPTFACWLLMNQERVVGGYVGWIRKDDLEIKSAG